MLMMEKTEPTNRRLQLPPLNSFSDVVKFILKLIVVTIILVPIVVNSYYQLFRFIRSAYNEPVWGLLWLLIFLVVVYLGYKKVFMYLNN